MSLYLLAVFVDLMFIVTLQMIAVNAVKKLIESSFFTSYNVSTYLFIFTFFSEMTGRCELKDNILNNVSKIDVTNYNSIHVRQTQDRLMNKQ